MSCYLILQDFFFIRGSVFLLLLLHLNVSCEKPVIVRNVVCLGGANVNYFRKGSLVPLNLIL